MFAITQWLQTNMVGVFFVYGLAFFVMGLAVALESRRSSALTLALSLKYLAAFGLLHSLVVWIDMFMIIQAQYPSLGQDISTRFIRTLLLASSTVCLILFGVKLISDTSPQFRWLRWVPLVLFLGWLFSFVIPHLYLVPGGQPPAVEMCLQCHRGLSTTYLIVSGDWLTSADIWTSYLLYLPGSVIAALAMVNQRPVFMALRVARLRQYCSWAAMAFGVNAIVAGAIVPPGPYFPASVLNYATFFAKVGVPPQILRAISASAIAYFIVRILNVFEIERQHQLEGAIQDRFEAQKQALASQRLARQQLEEWNRELEEVIKQRTQEIEQRSRQVVIFEERDRIAREMHDSLGQVLSYLGLRIMDIHRLLAARRLDEAQEGLHQVAKVVEEACADVRASILSLKTTIPTEGGLVPTLHEYLIKFSDQSGVKAEMTVDQGMDLGLSPLDEVQILRIIQEALTNVRKHAAAKRARVRFESREAGTIVVIEDDGQGFELDQILRQEGKFGLQIMRERAEEIGGHLSIRTSPSQGTRVEVWLPKVGKEGNAHGKNNGIVSG